jgi:hypothetical protein
MIEQKDLTGGAIAERIAALVADADRRARMATAARTFARPDAAGVIVDRALELVATWLHHMREGQPVELVPILVGGLHHYIYNGANPARPGQSCGPLPVECRGETDCRCFPALKGCRCEHTDHGFDLECPAP